MPAGYGPPDDSVAGVHRDARSRHPADAPQVPPVGIHPVDLNRRCRDAPGARIIQARLAKATDASHRMSCVPRVLLIAGTSRSWDGPTVPASPRSARAGTVSPSCHPVSGRPPWPTPVSLFAWNAPGPGVQAASDSPAHRRCRPLQGPHSVANESPPRSSKLSPPQVNNSPTRPCRKGAIRRRRIMKSCVCTIHPHSRSGPPGSNPRLPIAQWRHGDHGRDHCGPAGGGPRRPCPGSLSPLPTSGRLTFGPKSNQRSTCKTSQRA